MLIRKLGDVKNVDWGNGVSRRFLLANDGIGYTVTDTVVNAGTSSLLQYRQHLETCYCIAGRGEVIDEKGERHVIEPGVLYALDENDAHTLVAAPDQDLRLVCIFAPALNGDERHSLDSDDFSAY